MAMETWAGLGSALGSIIFLYSILGKYFPSHIDAYVRRHTRRLFVSVYPYVQITVSEYSGDRMKRSEAYAAIESYLTTSCSQHANKLKADFGKDSTNLTLSMDDHEEVTDDFEGVKLWWSSHSSTPRSAPNPWSPAPEERRSYKLTFHKRHRDLVVSKYINHVMEEGKAVKVRNRQRKLFTNNPSSNWHGYRSKVWNHVLFEHPASFDTVAMEPEKKKEILDDLDTFKRGKEYYAKVGKAWKRGYLLYGPPGTGKSTTVAAMANHMDYDIYDLELTTVKTNSDLRRLLIETTSKSIILIEDIDCTLDLTGERKQKSKKDQEGEDEEKKKLPPGQEKDESSRVTLSGLLNFIDGLWSASAGERLIVFTTNHKEKLDPALIRRGRMDKHIEMSYCTFEKFKVLARNYLAIDSHRTFERIRGLMEEVNITPADVAENLMPKSIDDHDHDTETCLESLIQALMAKEEEEAYKSKALAVAEKVEEGTNVVVVDESK